MTDVERDDTRLKALRDAPEPEVGPVRELVVNKLWLWRKIGLVLGVMIALLIAATMLSPIPGARYVVGGIDKIYQAIAFAVLVFPLILTDSRRWKWVVPVAVLYGGLIELIQPTVGRHAEWLDWGADVTGVLMGAALAELLHDRLRDRFFADDGASDESDADEAARLEAMRAEMMDELRVALHEELTSISRIDTAAGQEVDTPPGQTTEDPARSALLRH
ncbi:MAG: VanZ family protein [Rhodobacter sp.]|nr:VanZ family protein [Paracoccaceae bacterium]MCB1411059.1 VanZ family protein [Paracoccaceae bacterium]MCC0079993.1 VanZ family protein [Rhodobacter sp.]